MKIGLECHVQLQTQTKLFCGCANKFTDKPNTLTCDYCIGLPGTKPRINKSAVDAAILIGEALECKISAPSFFSRKAYFYPDMGKNFQITQYEVPIAYGGRMKLGTKMITIKRIQIEEDPARLVHVGGGITSSQYVLVDYNRSGVPLVEIVTDPDFESPKEAREFLQKLSSILQYLGVYNPDIEGSLRVDANISVDVTRVEIKNISGFKEVERALNYEIVRQNNVIRRKQKVVMETRGWDANAGVTRSQRTKETEDDYGYIFEGDLPQFSVDQRHINELKNSIPELPDKKVTRYTREMRLPEEIAVSIVSEPDLAEAFEKVAQIVDKQLAAKWFAGEIKKTLNYNTLHFKESKLNVTNLTNLLLKVERKEITDHTAEMMLRDMVHKEVVLDTTSTKRIDDEKALEEIVREVIDSNTKAVLDYKSGKTESFNYLVGQVMRKTQGRADSTTIRKIMSRLI